MKSINFKLLIPHIHVTIARITYQHTFLSPRPPINLIYGLLTSEIKFHTPENKMGKTESVPEYTNLPRVFHAGKKVTIINTIKKA